MKYIILKPSYRLLFSIALITLIIPFIYFIFTGNNWFDILDDIEYW